jgi:hypothetical protein
MTTSLPTLANIYEKEQRERAHRISPKPWYVRPQWKELQNNHKEKKKKKKGVRCKKLTYNKVLMKLATMLRM